MEVYADEDAASRPGRRPWRALAAAVTVVAFLAVVSLLPGGGPTRESVTIGGGDFGGTAPAPQGSGQVHAPAGAKPSGAAAPASTGTSGAASMASGPSARPASGPAAPTGAGAGALIGGSEPNQIPACGSGPCVTVDATAPGSRFSPIGTGLNQGVEATDRGDSAAMSALGVSNFRGAPTYGFLGSLNWSEWDAAATYAKSTTLILSNLWQERNSYPYPPTPWSNWGNYKSWLTTTVKNVLSSGRRVTYWEVFSEPGWHGYYSPKDFASETPADLLQQFLVTYTVIKGIDPSAQIVGPSTGLWSLTPVAPSASNHEFDLGTFLRFAAANHLKLAAIAWHDNGLSPAQLQSDAAATEALIRDLPALGQPPMILQEFASEANQPIPGWDVAFLAAAAHAGFVSADRSCWGNACDDGELDGLLAPDGVTKTAEYWERLAYADMTGRAAVVSSNNASLSGLGAVDTKGRKLTVLLGRDASCASQAWCNAEFPPGSQPAVAVPVLVRVHMPWADPAPLVTLSADPFQLGVVPGAPGALPVPGVTITPAAAGGGEWASFTIPSYADGEAFSLSITG